MNATYSNRLSRLLFRSAFETQWILPRPIPPAIRRFFTLYEKTFVHPNIEPIRIDRPIFIISLPRSGSSMLQDLLSAHEQTGYITNMMHLFWPCFCGAEMFRRRLRLNAEGERFLNDSVMVNGETPADPLAAWDEWYNLDPQMLELAPRTPDTLSPRRVQQMRHDIRKVLWCFNPHGGARFLSKNPGLLPYIELTAQLFPDARFIYLVRDPRQNANSMLKLHRLSEEQRTHLPWNPPPIIPYPRLPNLGTYIEKYGADSLETTARLWRDSVRFIEPWQSSPQVHTVRYEDIVKNPASEMRSILRFCELDGRGTQNDAFQQRLAGVGTVRHTNPSYGGYERIQEICAQEMAHFNYA
jgi:hypothetical protein